MEWSTLSSTQLIEVVIIIITISLIEDANLVAVKALQYIR